ncbi:MAG TPA: diguanylate cyclase [Gemmatimonadaceae bacterium]|nr:diguanylate cyclase [Gemmatimonadaceae bacterium]
MGRNLISRSAVTRPLKPLGKLLKRLLGGSRSRAPGSPPDTRHNGSDSEKRLSFMLESVPVNLWSTDARLNITFAQGAGPHLIGSSANEQVGMTLYEVLKSRDPRFTPLAAHLRALQGELVRYEVEWRGRSFETRVEPLRSADGHITGTVGIAIDITDRKTRYDALPTQNVYFAALFENAPEAIALLDEHDNIIRINRQFTTLFGYGDEEAVGRNINHLIVPNEFLEEGEKLTATVASGEKVGAETLRRHKDGHTFWVSINATPFRVGTEPARVYAMYHDISARKRAEAEIRALLLDDELTGLPNRRAFINLSEQALKQATRMERDVLMIFIDVDQLKHINDTWGHLAGDRALIDTARVLRESCREADIVARLGGDEFVALMTVDSDQTADIVRERIQARVEAHNRETERGYPLSLSVGATRSKAEGTMLADLLAQADTALYEQKRGRARAHALSR